MMGKQPKPKTTATKQAKARPEKYDEKLAIDGTFEDVIGISVTPLKASKFKVGDTVTIVGDKDNSAIYTVIATKENPGEILVPDGIDYVIQKKGSAKHENVFEEDLIGQ